jgi:hypothetical protein
MEMPEIIRQQAQLARNSGASVDLDTSMPTVCISAPGEPDIFMQGDDARQFEDQVRAYEDQYPDVDSDDIELFVAWPYIENIWG